MNAKPELPEEVKRAESPEKKKRRWLALALAVAMILAVWKFWLPYWGINAQALRQMPRLHQGDYTQEVAVFSGQSKSVATSGCGAVCMAMAISYLHHTQVSPQDLFAWAYDQGFYYGDGLGHEALTAMAEKYGLHSQWIDNDQLGQVRSALEKGYPVVAHMGPGTFTKGGHYILLRGVEGEEVLVNDPQSEALSQQPHSLEDIRRQLRRENCFMIVKP